MIVTYLRTAIDVRAGTSSSGEVAWAEVDGERRCFLGGLTEAKRFLRERRAGEVCGPRPASWHIALPSGCSSSYSTREVALSDLAYYRREGMAPTMSRTEWCTYPGCDGRGEVRERARRHAGVTLRPCPRHLEPVEVVEWEPGDP